jgi:hypothetical protein
MNGKVKQDGSWGGKVVKEKCDVAWRRVAEDPTSKEGERGVFMFYRTSNLDDSGASLEHGFLRTRRSKLYDKLLSLSPFQCRFAKQPAVFRMIEGHG